MRNERLETIASPVVRTVECAQRNGSAVVTSGTNARTSSIRVSSTSWASNEPLSKGRAQDGPTITPPLD